MDTKRFFLYFVVIAALALAGCGSGGNGGMTAMVDPADEQAAIEQATKAAGTKLDAIKAEDGEDDYGLGGIAGTGIYRLNVARGGDGTTVKITDPNMADKDDPKFATAMELPTANGFAGTMNVRTMEADDDGNVESEVAVVRTNIDAPTPTLFEEVEGQMFNTNPQSMGGVYQSLAIHGDDANDESIDFMKITGPSAAEDGQQTKTHMYNDLASTMDVNEAMFMGTYNGANGTYACSSASGCTVTTDEEGMVTEMEGNWMFTPDAGATSPVPDSDYLAYGIWLKRTKNADGATTYNEVQAFYRGEGFDEFDGAALVNVSGTATYTGNSTGVYVKNVFVPSTSGGQEIDTATSGLYSADVTLKATFGGGNIGAHQQYWIDGDVTNFKLGNGEANDWSVKLEPADLSGRDRQEAGRTTEPGTKFMGTFASTTTGDAMADKGAWEGSFFGTPATPGLAPSNVAGEFNAFFTDGAVLGGFGAEKQE